MTRRLAPWIPALVWAATIFVLSSLPGSAYPATNLWNADKLVHVALYGLLGGLCARGFASGAGRGAWAVLGLAALVSTLYGVSDELHQWFVPGRNCDWHDAVADAAGSLVGAAVVAAWAARNRAARVGAVR
jgi:VanZ family protein